MRLLRHCHTVTLYGMVIYFCGFSCY